MVWCEVHETRRGKSARFGVKFTAHELVDHFGERRDSHSRTVFEHYTIRNTLLSLQFAEPLKVCQECVRLYELARTMVD